MNEPKQLFTYAIAVFESLWPRITNGQGDESPKLVGKSGAKSAFKYSGSQNEFTGYFKLIPLNILQVDTTSTKQGHQFRLTLDASLLYVEADPKSLSANLADFLRKSTLPVSHMKMNALVGIMEGYSRDAFSSMSNDNIQRYVIPGEIFSQLVSEMDTCTLFMVNELGDFQEDELIKICGGSFSRINELDTTENGKKLVDIGILPTMEPTDIDTFTERVSLMRGFVSNTGLYLNRGVVGGTAFRLYDTHSNDFNEEIDRIHNNELRAVHKFLSTTANSSDDPESESEADEATLSQVMGHTIAKEFLPSLERRKDGVASSLYDEINEYYDSNRTKYLVPWSVYKTITINIRTKVNSEFEGLTSQDGGESLPLRENIARAVAIDILAANYSPDEYGRLRTDSDYTPILETIIEEINNRHKLSGEPYVVMPEHYELGVVDFSVLIKELLTTSHEQRSLLPVYETDTLTRGITGSKVNESLREQGLEELVVPISSHTPGFILKGHITGIESTSSVGTSSTTGTTYNKTVTITGNGCELPLKRHTIFYDQINRGRPLFFNFMKFGISNASPIEAALSIMETFAPDYVEVRNADSEEISDHGENARNFEIFRDKEGTIVDQGTVIYPEANSPPDKALLATPIHYVHNGFLRLINDAFDEVELSEFVMNQNLRAVDQTNLYNVLGGLLGQGSAYVWYIDEFGFIKVRYENASASAPSPTVLSPIVCDDKIISISTSTSEEHLYTMVEVVPHGVALNSPSEGKMMGVFGRATPPTVDDYYALYDIKTLDIDDENVVSDVANLLKESLTAFNKVTMEAVGRLENLEGDNTPTTVFNDADYDRVRDAITSQPSIQAPASTETVEKQYAVDDDVVSKLLSRIKTDYHGKFTPGFLKKVVEVSDRLGIRPEWLITVMGAETDGSFDPAQPNYGYVESKPLNNTAIGLIQFLAATAAHLLGLTDAAEDRLKARSTMGAMTQVAQMNYVEAYLEPYAGKMNDLGGVYLAVFKPAALIADKEYLYFEGTEAYEANKSLDVDPNDGVITRTELTARATEWEKKIFILEDLEEVLPVSVTPEEVKEAETVITPVESIYKPAELRNIYETVGDVVQSYLYNAILYNSFDNLSSRSSRDVLIYDLNSQFKQFFYEDDNGERVSTLYDYIAKNVENTVTSLKLEKISISGFTLKGRGDYVKLLSTLSVIGASPKNIEELLKSDTNQARLVKFVLRSARLYIDPKELNQFPASALVLNATKGRALPYDGYELQQTTPQAISPDLFRYGLRIYRMDDYFMSTIQFTRFRAESIRRLVEEPIRSANVSIIGTPMYKVGNTALVVTRELEERKYNYINQGSLKTLENLGRDRDRIIFKVDDAIEDGLKPKLNNPFSSVDEEVTVDGIYEHFISAYEFIHSLSPYPVPITAYVPLYGVYNNDNGPLRRYLTALVRVSTKTHSDYYSDYEALLQEAVLELVESVHGSNYSMKNVNDILNLLSPQYYHAYQYYIEQVKHNWQFGGNYKTSLSMNYGIPASICHIPVSKNDYSRFHIIGYLLNKSPYMLYNDRGKKGDIINMDHPLYNFTLRQQEEEWSFYKNSERYDVALVLDKIRKKILYPELYGEVV